MIMKLKKRKKIVKKLKTLVLLSSCFCFFQLIYPMNVNGFTADEYRNKINYILDNWENKQFNPDVYGDGHNSYYTCTKCGFGSWECLAFARYAQNQFYNVCEKCGNFDYLYSWNINSIDDLRVGDVIRYATEYYNHSIVIIDTNGNSVRIMDCNKGSGDNHLVKSRMENFSEIKEHLNTILNSIDNESGAAYLLRYPGNDVKSLENKPEQANIGTDFTAAMMFNYDSSENASVISANDLKGNNVEISTKNKVWEKNQLWKFERQNDGSYYIKNVQSDLYLDVDNEKTSNGTNIKTWKYSSSTAQKWCIIELKSGGYRLIPKHCYDSGLKRGLDIDAGGTTSGTNVHLWEYLGNANEKSGNQTIYIKKAFYLKPENLGTEFIATMTYKQKNSEGTAIISENGQTKGSNVEISIQNKELQQSQVWKFERQNDESYYIKNMKSNLYLDVDNEKTSNGTNIKIYNYSNSTAQKWYIVKVDERYRLIPKHCYDKGVRACLDIDAGGTISGTNVHLWNFLAEANDYGATQVVYINKDVYKKGDINGDGKINIKDWNILYAYINETMTLSSEELQRADVNEDGKINVKDLNRLYEHITETNPLD